MTYENSIPVSPRVSALRTDFEIPVNAETTLRRSVRSYLIYGERVHAVDNGVAASFERIRADLESRGRRLADLATVVLTHAHPDHVGSARLLRGASGCRILAHSLERACIQDTNVQQRVRPVPGFSTLVAGSVPVDAELAYGDVLALEPSLTLAVLHTPGHSTGSISLLLKEEGLLFTGDTDVDQTDFGLLQRCYSGADRPADPNCAR